MQKISFGKYMEVQANGKSEENHVGSRREDSSVAARRKWRKDGRKAESTRCDCGNEAPDRGYLQYVGGGAADGGSSKGWAVCGIV